MKINPHKIKQTSIHEEFKAHISADYNKRILFSAPFGSGKSTFLNDFFEEEKNYIVFKLYPVNYSVASNEDVFELIKYDLLGELLGEYASELAITELDFSPLLVAQSFALHELKVDQFAKSLIKFFLPKGKEAIEVVDAVKDIFDRYGAYKEKVRDKGKKSIDDYVKWCKKRKGSIYERDEITALEADLIERLKSKLNKPTVLVIDDLDRLDPEHVFRLFNIFCAHYDPVTDHNKFGFDKVVFACDYENIELMHRHRYGQDVDFKGYMDKFYSSKPFYFDNRKHLKEGIEQVLKQIVESGNNSNLDIRSEPFRIFVEILIDMIDAKVLTIRDITKLNEIDYPIGKITFEDHYNGTNEVPANEFNFLTIIHLLKKINATKELIRIFAILNDWEVEIPQDQLKYNSRYRFKQRLADAALEFLIIPSQLFGVEKRDGHEMRLNDKQYLVATARRENSNHNTTHLAVGQNQTFKAYYFVYEALKVCERKEFI